MRSILRLQNRQTTYKTEMDKLVSEFINKVNKVVGTEDLYVELNRLYADYQVKLKELDQDNLCREKYFTSLRIIQSAYLLACTNTQVPDYVHLLWVWIPHTRPTDLNNRKKLFDSLRGHFLTPLIKYNEERTEEHYLNCKQKLSLLEEEFGGLMPWLQYNQLILESKQRLESIRQQTA